MRTSSVEAVVLLVSVLTLLSLAPMAEAQVAAPQILEKVFDPEPIEYLLLATAQTATLQDEIAEAATQGYRLTSVIGTDGEAIVVMQRAPGQADPTHEYVVLGTKRVGTMEEEFLAAAANGFQLVGQSHYNNFSSTVLSIVATVATLGAAGGSYLPEMFAILERPIQDHPSRVAVLSR